MRNSIRPDVAAAEARRDEDCADIQGQIDSLIKRLSDLKARVAGEIDALVESRTAAAQTAETEAADLQARIDEAGELPAPTDISELRAELEVAKTVNRNIADRDRRAVIEKDAAALEAQSEALTKAMAARVQSKLDAIASASMPVAGLSFGDGVVTYNELPLDQASDAEQLMVSTAIAAALNPKLRVLRIRDGSLLDDAAMERLATFATERDFQIWIERVDGSGTVGFVMEDGHVKGSTPAAEAAE